MPPLRHTGGWARYARWIDRNRRLVLVIAALVAAAGGALTLELPIRADFSHLLPPNETSVVHLHALEARARAFGTVFAVVRTGDPELRRQASQELYQACQSLDPELAAHCTYDDAAVRAYFWQHRFLFVDLDELRDAKQALADKIRRAKLDANPLYVSLEDDADQSDADLEERVQKLRDRLDEAERKAAKPEGFVDGENQVIIIQSTFSSSEVSKGKRLVAQVEKLGATVRAAHPGSDLEIGLTGNVVQTQEEQASIVRGVVLAAVITVLLCALALFLYYRSALPVTASLWSLAVGVLATLGFTKLAIGHLNLVTAFLAAIVVGNGINAGLILLARYFEQLREGRQGADALAGALAGAARGTLAASLTAGAAYGSLVVTDFRGFRHFGVIGGVGMVLCWVAAFTVLPAGLCALERRGWIRVGRAPAVGRILARLLPRRSSLVLAAGGLVALASVAGTYHYVTSDYMERDWRNLRSQSREHEASEVWLHRVPLKLRQGIPGRFVIGLDRREEAPRVVAQLRELNDRLPADHKLLGDIHSLDDLLPTDQPAKIALLDQIRTLLDDDVVDQFSTEDAEMVARIRPPPGLRPLGDDDVPEELAWPFVEKDGTRGRLIHATSAPRFETYNVDHRVEFAAGVRAIDLPPDAVVGGQAFIVADMVEAMKRDGPRASVVALLCSVLVVWLVVGLRRHGAVTLLCAGVGVLAMISLVDLWGLKVNFLDFVALPITIGLGIDYTVNLAVRERQEWQRGPHAILATTGGAVLLCSFTTIVGYGSLLLSENAGIRSFGLAAILGEFACVLVALGVAPVLLHVLRTRAAARSDRS